MSALESKLDALDGVSISSRASQDSVDTLEAKLDTNLDTTVSSRASQASVDALGTVTAHQKIELQVITVDKNKRFLFLTTEAGQPVPAQLVTVQAITVEKNNPVTVQDVTANTTSAMAGSGILEVTINLPKSVEHVQGFVFTVEHSGVYGAIMIDDR